MDTSHPDSSAADRWAAEESLLLEALEHGPAERARFLDGACPDAAVRRELDALLAAHDRPGLMDVLGASVMAPLLVPRAVHGGTPAPAASGPPALGRYEVVERLGGGGMGVVYRARDQRLGRDVALKFLPPHLSTDVAAKTRFLVEARAAASLEHPNICTVHEIGETDDGQLYIVMAYYEGETLDRRIARGPLAVEESLRIAAELALGLAKAHDRGIVHRDVKPANVMLTADGLVKILDFGIAKLSDISVTQSAGIIGTLAYMSPEQTFGEAVDARSDVWALGVVLHEMLTGHRPFGGPGQQAVLYAILSEDAAPVSSLRPDVPPVVDACLRRALAKAPSGRHASAREMLADLTRCAESLRAAPTRAGATLAPRPASPSDALAVESLLTQAGERRHVGLVVPGSADYAALVERLGPTELDRVTRAARDAATEVATRHGGIVDHFAGADVVLLFGVTTAHEDDYLRAVRAALELHARVRALSPPAGAPLSLRSGIHVGPLVAQRLRVGERRFRVTGAPLDVATRLASLAAPDAILVSPECHRLVASFVDADAAPPVSLQPDAAEVVPWRVTAESTVRTRLDGAERGGLTPYVGRAREQSALAEQLEAAMRGEGRLVVVVGEPGAGKSRLLHELRRRVSGTRAAVALGRCDAYSGTTPYTPFVQAIRALLGVDGGDGHEADEVASRVRALDPSLEESLPLYCALLAAPSPAYPLPKHLRGEHLQAAMLDALAALVTIHARRRPTVLLFEDWHWADEASRAAVEQLADIAPAHALLIVVTCRPDVGLVWPTGEHRTVMYLGPLGLDASEEIMRGVLGASRLAPELVSQLHERTAGNPFFLEETCQALRESGALVAGDGEAVVGDVLGIGQLPETIQAVILTRLDRLQPEARHTLRMASVIGRDFTRGVLEELAGRGWDAGPQLDRLRASGLIQQTSIAPEPAYRFKHVLTQEVAYATVLEDQRVALHGAAARAIERRYADRLDEHLERLAHHCGRAEDWVAAVRHGTRAAARSTALSQFADALAMLDRTRGWVERFHDDDERRRAMADVLLHQERLCETLGLRARQIELVEELIALLAPHGGSARLAEAYLRQGDVCTLLRRFDAADRALGTSLRLSVELGDRAGERNALRSMGLLRSHEGRYADAVTSIERALALDEELGETAAAAGDVASLGNVLRKMGRQHDALEALERALERLTPQEDTMKWCSVMTVISAAHRDLGDQETALRYLLRVRDVSLDRRVPVMASFCLPAIAHIQLQQGEVDAALCTYREAVEQSRRARHADGLAQSLRALGETLFGLQRYSESVPCLREAAAIFARLEDRETETVLWQRAATALERCDGALDDAEQLWELVRDRREDAGDSMGEALALEGIARCARQRGMRNVAIAHYEHALARAVVAADGAREISLRNTLGLLRWEDGLYGEALRQYEAALRLCRELEDRIHEGLILNSVGATLLKLRRHDEARTALEEGIRANARSGERLLEAHGHALLGDVLVAAGRPRDAGLAYERALALRLALGDRRGEELIRERLSRILTHP